MVSKIGGSEHGGTERYQRRVVLGLLDDGYRCG